MRMENVEAVIFDLDETLIDAELGLLAARSRVTGILQDLLEEKGIVIDKKELTEVVKRFDDEMNQELKYDRDFWWQELIGKITPDIKLPKDIINRLTKEYWEAYEDSAIPYPDTLETLLHLNEKGYSLALVSDTDGKVGHKAERISRLEFYELFDVCIVAGDETAELKPTGLPFLLAADRLVVPPKACVVVGDKPFADIVGGKRAGMRTILIVRRRWDTTVESDHEITCLAELRTLL